MNKFERLLIEKEVGKRDFLEDLKFLRKNIILVMHDYEELGEKKFREKYPRCEYTYEGLCYYRRLLTKKINVVKQLYKD